MLHFNMREPQSVGSNKRDGQQQLMTLNSVFVQCLNYNTTKQDRIQVIYVEYFHLHLKEMDKHITSNVHTCNISSAIQANNKNVWKIQETLVWMYVIYVAIYNQKITKEVMKPVQ